MSQVEETLSFDDAFRMLMDVRTIIRENLYTRRNLRRLAYTDVLLVMLYNGLRVNEARLCIIEWLRDPSERTFIIPVLKSRGKRFRYCEIPEFFDHIDRAVLERYLPLDKQRAFACRIWRWSKRVFGVRSHEMRRLFIMKLYEMTIPEDIVKLVGWADMRPLKSYITPRSK